jgi:PAS domain S-box-containing protein
MWGLPSNADVNMDVFLSGIHPDDLARVQQAIAACADPLGDGTYSAEYRVIGQDDGRTRHISSAGRMTFSQGRAVCFIGAVVDVTSQRRSEAAMRASEAQFRSFADHSRYLIWIADPKENVVLYRSAAYEEIWGIPRSEAPATFVGWMREVHPEDRTEVEEVLRSLKAGDVAQLEYRIVRRSDGTVRFLRDTSFPILDEQGAVARIGGITEDLTQDDIRQVYIVSSMSAEALRLAGLVRASGYRARTFDSSSAFLALAPVLMPGCVLVDLRRARGEGLSIPRELKMRSIALPTIALDAEANVDAAVAAMKAGAVDYVTLTDETSLRGALAGAMAECRGLRTPVLDESAGARIAKLTPREREVLVGLIEGGTNKTIGRKLGISPRTVELHRAQVMNRLDASNLTELLQIAFAAGIPASARRGGTGAFTARR